LLLKLQRNDGSKSLETFLLKFQHLAVYLKWNEEDHFHHPCASLEGPAGQVLWELPPSVTTADLERLLQSLALRGLLYRHGAVGALCLPALPQLPTLLMLPPSSDLAFYVPTMPAVCSVWPSPPVGSVLLILASVPSAAPVCVPQDPVAAADVPTGMAHQLG